MTFLDQPAMAAMLPVEIIQSILFYMDIESYLAARLTCRSWRSAASTPLMTYKTVRKVPVALPPTIQELDETEWGIYLDQVGRVNLLGFRNHVERTVTRRRRTIDCTGPANMGLGYPGRRVARSKGSPTVDENEIKQQLLQFPLTSSLYPLWTSVCRALSDGCNDRWMAKHQPNVQPHLALSGDGQILAIGFGKRIQIYSALDGKQAENTSPVEYLIKDDTHGIIEALEFEDDDKLLRLVIDKQPSRVRYLGLPSQDRERPDLGYWRKCIEHIYLDSVELARHLSRSSTTRLVLAGLRLLPLSDKTSSVIGPRSEEHRHFTACLQTGHIDSYCMGSISFFPPAHANSMHTANIDRLLPSKHFQPYTAKPPTRSFKSQNSTIPPHALPHAILNPDNAYSYGTYSRRKDYQLTNIPRWDQINLPSATCDTPHLAISDDSRMLIVYEPCASPKSQGGSVYVYNIEPCIPMYQPFPRTKAQSPVDWSIFGQDFGGLGLCFVFSAAFDMIKSKMTDVIPSWPFLLDRVDVDITSLKVTRDSDRGLDDSYVISAKTSEGDLEWKLTRS